MDFTVCCQAFFNFFGERISLENTPFLLNAISIQNKSKRRNYTGDDCQPCDITSDNIGRIYTLIL